MAQARPSAAINPQAYVHYTEHLAPLCVLMNIPLILIEPKHHELALKYYPGLDAKLMDWEDFTPNYLMEHFDVLFRSEIWDMEVIWEKFKPLERVLGKRLRCVHCPHGFSDKVFWFERCVQDDITLVYGQNMLDMLQEQGVLDQLRRYVLTGNYRLSYYRKYQELLDKQVEEDIFSQFAKKQPTILYAPTWSDKEESSSFFDATRHLIDSLPESHNLLVKLHPHIEDYDAVELFRIIGTYDHKPNVVFLEQYPTVYPILARSDYYVGDMSSVGYDFLAFNRPMFFLNQKGWKQAKDRRAFLFQCGTVIDVDAYQHIHTLIEEGLETDQERFGRTRQEIYEYTFGKERPFDDIRQDIVSAYNEPIAD